MKNQAYFEFIEKFGTNDKCLKFLKLSKYPRGIHCVKCRRKRKFYRVKNRPVYGCMICRHQISILKDTIFEGTHLPLTLWFLAIFLITHNKSGLSASALARMGGVSYKGAWRMLHQIRSLMIEDKDLIGKVEVDETFIGGSAWNNYRLFHKKRVLPAVLGMVERNGRAILLHLPYGVGSRSIIEPIRRNIDQSAHIMTDQMPSYKQLKRRGYKHDWIVHRREFKRGNIYTQTVEGLFSQFKRGITGVYRYVSEKHLQSYCNEYTYKYSHRGEDIFRGLVKKIVAN